DRGPVGRHPLPRGNGTRLRLRRPRLRAPGAAAPQLPCAGPSAPGPGMSGILTAAASRILVPVGLDEGHVQKVLDRLMARDIDDADLYFEATRSESWVLEDSIIREGSHSIDQGVGVRAVSGEKSGFAYSDEIVFPALERA